MEALRERVRDCDLVAGETRRFAPAAFRGRALSLEVRGVEPEGEAIRGVPLASGRLISREDVAHRRRVLVIGQRARERLLGAEGGIGSWVRIDGTPFQVVGVLERVGTQLSRDGAEIDDQLWVPLSVHLVLWPNPWVAEEMLSTILVRARDRERIDATEREMRRVLAERLGVPADDEEAVPIFSPVKMLRRAPARPAERAHLLIAVTTLLVGGIGILAMMLDSVQERRAEIGVRLALGARRRDVLLQFFLEGVAIVALGGALGVALGAGGALFLASDAFRGGIPPALRDLVPVPELSAAMVLLAVLAMGGGGARGGRWCRPGARRASTRPRRCGWNDARPPRRDLREPARARAALRAGRARRRLGRADAHLPLRAERRDGEPLPPRDRGDRAEARDHGPGVIAEDRVGERGSREVELEPEDVARIEALDVVEHASPNVELHNQPVRRGRRTKLLNVVGWDHDAAAIRNFRAAEGRFLSARDVAEAAAGRLPRAAREAAPVRRRARARRDASRSAPALPRDRHRQREGGPADGRRQPRRPDGRDPVHHGAAALHADRAAARDDPDCAAPRARRRSPSRRRASSPRCTAASTRAPTPRSGRSTSGTR